MLTGRKSVKQRKITVVIVISITIDMLELYKQVVDLKKVELVTQHMEVILLTRPLFVMP